MLSVAHLPEVRAEACISLQIQRTKSSIKKRIIVRRTVRSMFGEQTFAQLRTGFSVVHADLRCLEESRPAPVTWTRHGTYFTDTRWGPTKTGERAPKKGSHSLWSRNPDWPQALLGENPEHSVVTQTIPSFVVMSSFGVPVTCYPVRSCNFALCRPVSDIKQLLVSDSTLCQTAPCFRQTAPCDRQHPVSDSTASCVRQTAPCVRQHPVSDNTLCQTTPSPISS